MHVLLLTFQEPLLLHIYGKSWRDLSFYWLYYRKKASTCAVESLVENMDDHTEEENVSSENH